MTFSDIAILDIINNTLSMKLASPEPPNMENSIESDLPTKGMIKGVINELSFLNGRIWLESINLHCSIIPFNKESDNSTEAI